MPSQLPLELVDAIADLLPHRSVQSLSLVSTTLYAALFPRLHRAITFRASNEWALNILDVSLFLGEILHYTRQLTVKAPIRIARFHHCVFNSNFFAPAMSPRGLTLGGPHEPTAHRGFSREPVVSDTPSLNPIRTWHPPFIPVCIETLPEGAATDLPRWHIGTCIPANVLDVQGYLVHHQKQIRHLSLITDGTCPHAGQHLEGLSCFTALNELEWEGIQHPSEVSALRGCLQQNSRHLKALSVGFLSAENPPGRCGFADIVDLFPSSFRDDRTRPGLDGYSLLTLLTLSRVSFPSALLPGIQPSPFRALQALTLRDCPNDLRFLQFLARSSTPVSPMGMISWLMPDRNVHFLQCITKYYSFRNGIMLSPS